MRYIVRITYDKPPDASIRAWRTISKHAFMELGLLWDRSYKMRHFEQGAAQRYNYRPRSPKYEARKRKMASMAVPRISRSAALPLIYSGATRRIVSTAQVPHAYPTRVTITMPTPNYFQMRPRRPDRPNLGDESTRVIPEEMRVFERVYVDDVERGLAQYRATKATVIQ